MKEVIPLDLPEDEYRFAAPQKQYAFLRGLGRFSTFSLEARRKVWNQWRKGYKEGLLFPRCDFSHADLSQFDLHHSSFRGANFSHANLTLADASQCDFGGADLTKAILSKGIFFASSFGGILGGYATLVGADCSEANFSCAVLRGCNLQSANFNKANLVRANIAGANILQATFRGAHINNIHPPALILSSALE